MSKIFFSYRRTDSGSMTGRIIDRFKKKLPFAEIFHDVESIPVGKDFLKITTKKLEEADIFIPIIGNSWATSLKKNELDENDYVRIEIEQALASGVYIIPVFVEGAVCPTPDEVPKSISKISHYNGLPVRPGGDFEHDINKLILTVKEEIFKNASVKDKLRYKIKSINTKIISVAVASFLIVALAFNFLFSKDTNIPECTDHKKAAIVAKFSENDDKGLSNTILTKLEKSLPDSLFNVRTSDFQNRNVDSYHSFIRNKYFDNKCDTIGLFINGYYNETNEIFNVYTSNIGLKLFQPDYVNKKNIVLDSPKDITFQTKKDAEFLADFIILLLLSGGDNNSENLRKNYEFQKKYNLTNENQAQFGNKSILSYMYIMRANNYALTGNDKKATEYYNEAKKIGNTATKAIAIKNNLKVNEITQIMEANPELQSVRQSNIEEHREIEMNHNTFNGQVEDIIEVINEKLEEKIEETIEEKTSDVKTKLQEQLIKNNKKKEEIDERRRLKKEERKNKKNNN